MSDQGPSIKAYIDSRVLVMTSDGRIYVGVLKACDQATNLVLDQTIERIYSSDEGVKSQQIGLYVLRGDHVVSVGEIDEDLDKTIDLERIRAEPIKPF
eukprot:jgi/Ulvmu1/3125/UM015_0165.1